MFVPGGVYECVGGPLCGSFIKAETGRGKYKWRDKKAKSLTWHYYRLVMLASPASNRTAIFFHYFGTKRKRAERGEPSLVPGRRLWK